MGKLIFGEQMLNKFKKLTIITVSHRNLEGLVNLISQIQPALSKKINWLIKDSGCCEQSAIWAKSITDSNIHFYSGSDSGIYSALNFALNKTESDFYLVVGSDDNINTDSLREIGDILQTRELEEIDIASFPVIIDGKVFHKKSLHPLCISIAGLISSHSVGTIIRRSLHEKIGFYDEDYKILADSLFIRKCLEVGAKFKNFKFPVIGSFSTGGISRTQHARRILESYSYNVACGDSQMLQSFFLLFRTIKNKPSKFI